MFKFVNKKKDTETIQQSIISEITEEIEEKYIPKYSHPKILLMDIDKSVEKLLRKEGYNISIGSFGTPYNVPKENKYRPIIFNGEFSENTSEQDIIVIDLIPKSTLPQLSEDKLIAPIEDNWWASCIKGVIDPRPKGMMTALKNFNRVLEHGGIFIVFAVERDLQDMKFAHQEYSGLSNGFDIKEDNWCFLSLLQSVNLEIESDDGNVIEVSDKKTPLGKILVEFTYNAKLYCTFHPTYQLSDVWVTLATNKFGAPVSGAIIPKDQRKGLILILPRIKDKANFISKLFKEILPDAYPNLFPDFEGFKWINNKEYIFPKVLAYKTKIQEIQYEANNQIKKVEGSINEECEKYKHLNDLIITSDRTLVIAVKTTLEMLGFKKVIDVDNESLNSKDDNSLREDLDIMDYSPALLVEVKGITYSPSDDDALQVTKYIAPRKEEWGRIDVQGLTIINHQKYLPPLERNNETLFRPLILTNAKSSGFGLMTTWDLYRLSRSYVKNNWQHSDIKDLFYRTSRMEIIPSHYEYIGNVEKYWDEIEVVSIKILKSKLNINDKIAFEFEIEFEEQEVNSMEVNNKPVNHVEPETIVGIQTLVTKEQAKKGIRVFKVLRN